MLTTPALLRVRRLRLPRHAARRIVVAGTALLALNCAAGAGFAPPARTPIAVAQEEATGATVAPVVVRNDSLGLAHIDVMDLHAVRQPDAPPAIVEPLGRADITDRYDKAVAASASWHRWSMYWDMIDGGTFSWAVTDGIVDRDVARGLQTIAVLQGNPPGVRHVTGAPPGIDAPVFLTGDGKPTDDPALAAQINPANTWARFVAATVDRYRPGGAYSQTRGWLAGSGVRHWEIGNEPNLSHFWHGTPADFVRYLESAYLAAKWRDPDAVIIHGGIANDANAGPWYEQFADALRARAAASPLPARYDYYFDAAAWHWYTQVPYLTVPPARARSILSERGIPPKPIWVTEFGAPVGSEYPGPCWDPSSPGRVTTAEQSAFVWQTVAEGFSSGVEVMVYFQLFDDCGNGMESYDAFGLVRNHAANQCWAPPIGNDCWRYDPAMAGTTRPAYDAFRTIARELAGAHAVESTSGYGWQRVAFSRPPGARVTVAWNTTSRDRTIEIPAVAETATLFELDASGAVLTRTATSGAGRYQVLLTGATNRTGFMGRALTAGRPVILVEGSGFASAGYTSGAADRSPPYIAVVGELPALSAPRLDLAVLAADEASPLVALQVFYSIGAPPRDASGWLPVGSALPWPGTPQMGMVTLPFVGAPGLDYYFSAQAADAAGNWSAVPPYAQAHTRIVDDRRPLATPAPTVEPKAALRAPSAR